MLFRSQRFPTFSFGNCLKLPTVLWIGPCLFAENLETVGTFAKSDNPYSVLNKQSHGVSSRFGTCVPYHLPSIVHLRVPTRGGRVVLLRSLPHCGVADIHKSFLEKGRKCQVLCIELEAHRVGSNWRQGKATGCVFTNPTGGSQAIPTVRKGTSRSGFGVVGQVL